MTFDIVNLKTRIRSSLLLVPAAVGIVWLGGFLYALAIVGLIGIGFYEWLGLVRRIPNQAQPLSQLRKEQIFWISLGIIYMAGSGLALLFLRLGTMNGLRDIAYLLAVVWGTDIGAFVVGRVVGGPKLAPRISPNKTWAGLGGGMVLAALLGSAIAAAFGTANLLLDAFFALGLAIVAQAGDFFESWIKRRAGAKESGTLIPGHGGLLDRIDGLVFAAMVMALFRYVTLTGMTEFSY